MATSTYLQKVQTRQQSKQEFGWIVNPTISFDKIPRVSTIDLNLNQIFQDLQTPSTAAQRGELIHQVFQLLMSSSFLGKKTSSPQENLEFIKALPQLSPKDTQAIQNGCLFMTILNAKGFSLMFLEETILLATGKHKRMDAVFYNQEQDTLFIIDWKTGTSCDDSTLETLILYANRMKEKNPKTKIGMFMVYVDLGVVLPGWLRPKIKRNGVKNITPNFFKFMYYSLTKDLELDMALFTEQNLTEDLEKYKIPSEYNLAQKHLCVEDLSDQDLQQFGTIGDYHKVTTRSGKEYDKKAQAATNNEKQTIVSKQSQIEECSGQINVCTEVQMNDQAPSSHEKPVVLEDVYDSSQQKEEMPISVETIVQPEKKIETRITNSESFESSDPATTVISQAFQIDNEITLKESTITKQSDKQQEQQDKQEQLLWSVVCEGSSFEASARKYKVEVQCLKTYFLKDVVPNQEKLSLFWKTYFSNFQNQFSTKDAEYEKSPDLKQIFETYGKNLLKDPGPCQLFQSGVLTVKTKEKEELKEEEQKKDIRSTLQYEDLFFACIEMNSEEILKFYKKQNLSLIDLQPFYSLIFCLGMKDTSFISAVPDECFTVLSEK